MAVCSRTRRGPVDFHSVLNDSTGLLSRVPAVAASEVASGSAAIDPHASDNKVYAAVDVRAVDLERFPRFAHAKRRYTCEVTEGDCIRIPSFWWHNVQAAEGEINLSVNFWFSPAVGSAISFSVNIMCADCASPASCSRMFKWT